MCVINDVHFAEEYEGPRTEAEMKKAQDSYTKNNVMGLDTDNTRNTVSVM